MSPFPLPLTKLIHENLSLVMMYVYSRRPLADFRATRFRGDWKYLDKALFQIPEEAVVKALLSLALFIRHLDDYQAISESLSYPKLHETEDKSAPWTFGSAIDEAGDKTLLSFREVANKILHATSFEWDIAGDSAPTLICTAHPSQAKRWGWVRAEINIPHVAAACGQLMS